MWVIDAVVKEDVENPEDGEVGRNLERKLGEGVNHKYYACSQCNFKFLWVYLQSVLLQGLGEMLRRFRVGIMQFLHTLMVVVVVVLVLDCVENSHQGVQIVVSGEGLIVHDARGYVRMSNDESWKYRKLRSCKCCWWML